MAEPERPLRVVRVVTIQVGHDWAALLNRLQAARNAGQAVVVIDLENMLTAPLGQWERVTPEAKAPGAFDNLP